MSRVGVGGRVQGSRLRIFLIFTVNVDIFTLQTFCASSPRRHIHMIISLRTYQFFCLFYYDHDFRSQQICAHLRPCAKCAEI